jgi:hypothetical protein
MLAGWKKYRTITIDHTNITADIANYPLFLNLSAAGGIGDVDLTSIFTELGASQLKLAVADATDAECYVEEVNWDSATPFAELWAQIPSVSTAADTIIKRSRQGGMGRQLQGCLPYERFDDFYDCGFRRSK